MVHHLQSDIGIAVDGVVVGAGGDELGKVGQVFVDNETGQPTWVTVKTGWFGGNQSFVPLDDASIEGNRVVVPYDQDKVKGAPNFAEDEPLSEQDEDRLYEYYDIGDRLPVGSFDRRTFDMSHLEGSATAARAQELETTPSDADQRSRTRRLRILAAELTALADSGSWGDDSADLALPAAWGPTPSEQERESAELANLELTFRQRAEVLERSVSRGDVASLLRMTDQAVTKLVVAGRLVALKDRGRWAIPTWQFDADSVAGVLPAIDRLAAAFPGGPVALSRWATRPSPDLNGDSPSRALAAGRVEEVVAVADALAKSAW
ncbi:PRC-barrel domain-containing protein [Nakamurella endophytica]|uniref:PRC-barrel domain-containing protein n=1 Tax=Nakamurella endophytica TaxID=1748367 RepID=A0A917SJA1_9ACTN|nr:PRC-barrel domain-containing protein [Nakamurella endophytica]GGL85202.1 hypothetical protein GCM10011594_01050 [Nakamurella endophytica]